MVYVISVVVYHLLCILFYLLECDVIYIVCICAHVQLLYVVINHHSCPNHEVSSCCVQAPRKDFTIAMCIICSVTPLYTVVGNHRGQRKSQRVHSQPNQDNTGIYKVTTLYKTVISIHLLMYRKLCAGSLDNVHAKRTCTTCRNCSCCIRSGTRDSMLE